MAAQVVYCTTPGATIHMDDDVRGAPWCYVVHNCIGWTWVILLWVSTAL